ncbi:hypothetical protein SprV_0301250000 [Sparganum proliferum]
MYFQERISITTIQEVLFADDCALKANTEGDMQRSMDLFAASCDELGLVIKTEKAVVMRLPPSDAAVSETQFEVDIVTTAATNGHPADAALWSGDVDGIQVAGTKSQPLPPQLSLADIEAEMAGLDPGRESSASTAC